MIRSNVEHWRELQRRGYFDNHPIYEGLTDFNRLAAVHATERFLPVRAEMKVVVIGCGYGRETLGLAPRVSHVWGIDVGPEILDRAVAYLGENGIRNFTPVPADAYAANIPDGIDLVFSVVVMQHLTRDLVRDYFRTLGSKLSPSGAFVVQFLEEFESAERPDAELKVYEPSVSWTAAEIVGLAEEADLTLREIRTHLATPTALWHWAYLTRREAA